MRAEEIRVVINWPTTAEGWAVFRQAMAKANTSVLVSALNQTDAPLSAKRAYLDSLGGHAPWGHKGGEGNA